MARLTLEKPSLEFRESYRELVWEFEDHRERLIPFPLRFPHDDFQELLNRLAAYQRGEQLPDGFVAHSSYWLVRGGSEVVGVSNLRHRLTDALRREGGHIGYGVKPSARRQGCGTELLRRTVERARARGLREVLLTCSATNAGSIGTILKNGGVLESEESLPERNEVVHRYTFGHESHRAHGR